MSTTGPTPRDDVDADADRHERHDDVGEEDRRVDAVPADRLQRDLGDQLRRRGTASSMALPARSARYSGSERPAWRMNQIGGRGARAGR